MSSPPSVCLPDIPADVYNRQIIAIVPTTVILFLSVLTYGLRIIARSQTKQSLGWDDYMMGLGLIILFQPSICQYLLVANGLGHHVCHIAPEVARRFARISFALQRANQPLLCCVKISILLFYMRVFSTKAFRDFRICVYVGIGYTLAWGVSTWFVNLTTCTPIAFAFDKTIPNGKCRNQALTGSIAAILSLLGDIYIVLLPLPILWRLKINTRRKVAVIGIFLLGSFGCIASFIRIFEIARFVPTDPTYTQVFAATWTTLEQGVAIISGNLPLLGPLFRGFFANKGNTQHTGSYPTQGGTGFRGDRKWARASHLGYGHGDRHVTVVSAEASPKLFTVDRFDEDEEMNGGIELDDKAILVQTQVEVKYH